MSWSEGRGPRAVPVGMINQVLRRWGRKCYLCGGPYDQIDHIVPFAEGGTNTLDNMAPICDDDHRKKSERERVRGYRRKQAKAKRPAEKHPSEGLKPS